MLTQTTSKQRNRQVSAEPGPEVTMYSRIDSGHTSDASIVVGCREGELLPAPREAKFVRSMEFRSCDPLGSMTAPTS